MRKNIIGSFESVDKANRALAGLESMGYTEKEVSIISSTESIVTDDVKFENNTLEGVGDSAKTGGLIGGVLGLLVGVGALTIPGLGLLFITGPIAAAFGITGVIGATASGALTGAIAGGLVGALKELGIDEMKAKQLEEDLMNDCVLVGVDAREDDESKIIDLYKNNDAETIAKLTVSAKQTVK